MGCLKTIESMISLVRFTQGIFGNDPSTRNNHPSNPQQSIHSLRSAPVSDYPQLLGGLDHFYSFFIFPNSWDDDPIWLSYVSGGRYTTNYRQECTMGTWFSDHRLRLIPRRSGDDHISFGGNLSSSIPLGAVWVIRFQGKQIILKLGLDWHLVWDVSLTS